MARPPRRPVPAAARARTAPALADPDSQPAPASALRARGRSARDRALARWLAAAGPWRHWTICPTLMADGPIGTTRLADLQIPDLHTQNTLFLLDLEPLVGVSVAAHLSATHQAH